MALSEGGLFSKARNTTDKYKKAQKDEQELISEIGKEMNSEYVGAKVTWDDFEKKKGEDAYKVEASKSGAENQQTFETEELGWRIWDYDGNILRIISKKPTKATLTLKGTAGYNNGVYLINEICRQCYGQYEKDGKTEKLGISVANLRRSDIQKVNTYDFTKYKHADDSWSELTDGTIQFGDVKTYESGFVQYPEMYEQDEKWDYENNNGKTIGKDVDGLAWEMENEDITVNEKISGEANKSKFRQSYYAHDFINDPESFKNQKYIDLIFKNMDGSPAGGYWLAGRCVHLFNIFCSFGLQMVNAAEGVYGVTGYDLDTSRDDEWVGWTSNYLRPIVTIDLSKTGYKLEKDDTSGKVEFKLVK